MSFISYNFILQNEDDFQHSSSGETDDDSLLKDDEKKARMRGTPIIMSKTESEDDLKVNVIPKKINTANVTKSQLKVIIIFIDAVFTIFRIT